MINTQNRAARKFIEFLLKIYQQYAENTAFKKQEHTIHQEISDISLQLASDKDFQRNFTQSVKKIFCVVVTDQKINDDEIKRCDITKFFAFNLAIAKKAFKGPNDAFIPLPSFDGLKDVRFNRPQRGSFLLARSRAKESSSLPENQNEYISFDRDSVKKMILFLQREFNRLWPKGQYPKLIADFQTKITQIDKESNLDITIPKYKEQLALFYGSVLGTTIYDLELVTILTLKKMEQQVVKKLNTHNAPSEQAMKQAWEGRTSSLELSPQYDAEPNINQRMKEKLNRLISFFKDPNQTGKASVHTQQQDNNTDKYTIAGLELKNMVWWVNEHSKENITVYNFKKNHFDSAKINKLLDELWEENTFETACQALLKIWQAGLEDLEPIREEAIRQDQKQFQ